MEILCYSTMQSPVGTLVVVVSERGLRMIEFGDRPFPPTNMRGVEWVQSEAKTRRYTEQLSEYFTGSRTHFDFPLDLRGTEFQKSCWQALLQIPFGTTCSYAEIARKVGRAGASRAVGQANHHNPIPIVVPCHRVITSNGTLGGYGGGLEMKRALLDLEKRTADKR